MKACAVFFFLDASLLCCSEGFFPSLRSLQGIILHTGTIFWRGLMWFCNDAGNVAVHTWSGTAELGAAKRGFLQIVAVDPEWILVCFNLCCFWTHTIKQYRELCVVWLQPFWKRRNARCWLVVLTCMSQEPGWWDLLTWKYFGVVNGVVWHILCRCCLQPALAIWWSALFVFWVGQRQTFSFKVVFQVFFEMCCYLSKQKKSWLAPIKASCSDSRQFIRLGALVWLTKKVLCFTKNSLF